MKITNTLTRKKEEFHPLKIGKVTFYSCGPTTYNFLHVGNAKALVVGDLIFRTLKVLGYDVTFVRNFTDVDDKIIAEAKKQNTDPLELSARFVRECEQDMGSLNMLRATYTPKVSECMPEIIQMIEDIVNSGAGYEVEGEVFYHVPWKEDYGKLSKKKVEDLVHGQRIAVDPKKKHPADFVLWKPTKADEPYWESPWGKGRPGWHIECSAMAKKFLGEQIDLHHGGVDLMFPHHENEMAQSEAANDCTFCGHWVHHEFVNFASEKMSKSLGNVITMRDFIQKYSGLVLRQVLISSHYRSRLEWNDQVIENAVHEVERLHEFLVEFQNAEVSESAKATHDFTYVIPKMREHLANDFNVPGVFAEIFSLIRLCRRELWGKALPSQTHQQLQDIVDFVTQALGCFGGQPQIVLDQLKQLKKGASTLSATKIEELIGERNQAKASKDWKKADEVRDQLKNQNVVLKDHPDGSVSWDYLKSS